MKFFIDTANIDEIKKIQALGVLDGVTTNPSLIAREGREFKDLISEITSLIGGEVSVEVTREGCEGMVSEALEFSSWAPNILVKVPITAEGLKAVNILKSKGVKTNVTLVFSPNQAILAAKAGATYVSIFVGRLDDICHNGMDVVRDTKCIFDAYGFDTKIIVASIRHPLHVIEASKIGVHAVTIPYNVIDKMLLHPLTDIGIDKFLKDWNNAKIK